MAGRGVCSQRYVLRLLLTVMQRIDTGHHGGQRNRNRRIASIRPVLLNIHDIGMDGCSKGLANICSAAGELDKKTALAGPRHLETSGGKPLGNGCNVGW